MCNCTFIHLSSHQSIFSAGVGRTGTFITIQSQMKRIKDVETVDIYNFVHSMRYRRCFMVQTEVSPMYTHMYIHTYVNTYIRTYIHTYVHTYIHTYIQAQYIFIHDALLEVIECGETEVSARELKEQYR